MKTPLVNSNNESAYKGFQQNNFPAEFTPLPAYCEVGETEHFVQFYEADEFLLNSLCEFTGAGLRSGEAVIVVATKAHREKLEELLEDSGVDVSAARASAQYIALDAGETLAKFMVGAMPDAGLFHKIIGNIISQASENRSRVRVYGEMVALLLTKGNSDAAIVLEKFWNDLLETHTFSLFCAYPINGFYGETFFEPLINVCAEHSRIIPTESYTSLDNPDERLRAIAFLQQKAVSLENEIVERTKAEETISSLLCISEKLNSTLDIDTLLDELVVEAVRLVRAESGVAGLYTPENGMTCRNYFQNGEWLTFEHSWNEMDGLPGWLIVHKTPYLTNDAADDKQIVRELCERFGVKQALSTPVLDSNGEILGFFEIHNKKDGSDFTRADCERLVAASQIAAIAIQNALAYREIQRREQERAELLAGEQIARARAEEASRLKDEFLATVSHELRTPLNAIIGWSHMLLHKDLDAEMTVRAIETIKHSAKSQAQLIEDILDVSRVITGKLRLNIEPVDASAIINSAIDSIQPAADSKNIKIAVTLDSSARRISGDANRLQQIIWNLLSNAIKFTPAGGRIEIRIERGGSDVKISVSDTGNGINPDFLPFIFDRFRQGDGSSTRRNGGLGLGLSIVRHLVELHGGTVSAESPGEGEGATFTITLPPAAVRQPTNGRKNGHRKLKPNGNGNSAFKPVPALNGVELLLVDDDADSLQVIALMLNGYGVKVQTADSAAEALEILEWYKPDVIVSDLAMPDEDGYSLIGKIRALETENGRRISAIALTAYVRVDDRTQALSAGFNMFVPKPVDPDELVSVISNLIESDTLRFDNV